MKTRLNKYLALPALLLCSVFAFTSCVKNFDGTTVDFSEKEQEITGRTGGNQKQFSGDVEIVEPSSGSPIEKSSHALVTLKIYSLAQLDMETVNTAVTFYRLKNNTKNPDYYPEHNGTVKIVRIIDSRTSKTTHDFDLNPANGKEAGIATEIDFELDTSSVTEDLIAVIVEAGKLKDKAGNFVLNLDESYIAGQESDSWIDYIAVTGTGITTNITATYDERFHEGYAPVDWTSLIGPADGVTGKYNFQITALDIKSPADSTAVYDSGFASKLNSCMFLRAKTLDKTEYEDIPLTGWTYDDSNHVFKTTSPVLAYRTTFTVVMSMPEITAPAWYKDVYGHPGFCSQYEPGTKFDLLAMLGRPPIETNLIITEPDFIVNEWGTSAVAWTAANFTEDYTLASTSDHDIFYNQGQVLYVNRTRSYYSKLKGYSYKWEISTKSSAAFDKDACDDFIVTDADYGKMEITKEVVKNDDGSVQKVIVTLKNPWYDRNTDVCPRLWVGNGTKLAAGTNPAHEKQLKFGTFKNPLMGDASGYTLIYKQ